MTRFLTVSGQKLVTLYSPIDDFYEMEVLIVYFEEPLYRKRRKRQKNDRTRIYTTDRNVVGITLRRRYVLFGILVRWFFRSYYSTFLNLVIRRGLGWRIVFNILFLHWGKVNKYGYTLNPEDNVHRNCKDWLCRWFPGFKSKFGFGGIQ